MQKVNVAAGKISGFISKLRVLRSPKCESITEDRIESNLSKTKNIPPKAVIFSDFCCTFAMSLMILLVLICSTKVSEKSDMAKS